MGAQAAVADQLLPGVVAGHRLVLLEGLDQVVERPEREPVPLDGGCQGDEHRMPRLAREALLELPPPPGQQLQRAVPVPDFVPEIVGPSAEGVERRVVVAQGARQQPAEDAEVLVAAVGQAPAPLPRLFHGQRLAALGAEGVKLLDGADSHGSRAVSGRRQAHTVPAPADAGQRGGSSAFTQTPASCGRVLRRCPRPAGEFYADARVLRASFTQTPASCGQVLRRRPRPAGKFYADARVLRAKGAMITGEREAHA
jgi:hypothetical protein